MTSTEIAEAIVAWAREQIPTLKDGFPYPGATSGDLPDVVVVVGRMRQVPGDPENFPFAGLEQTWLRVHDVELSVMVEQEDGRAGEKAAHQALEAIAETLEGSLAAGVSFGGEVMLSPRVEADLSEPFQEREDGIKGRTVYMTFAAAKRIEVG